MKFASVAHFRAHGIKRSPQPRPSGRARRAAAVKFIYSADRAHAISCIIKQRIHAARLPTYASIRLGGLVKCCRFVLNSAKGNTYYDGMGLGWITGLGYRSGIFVCIRYQTRTPGPVAHCAAYAVRLMSSAWCLLLKMSDHLRVCQMCTKFWMSTYHDRLLLATCTCSAAARQHVTIPSAYDDLTVSAFASSPGLRNKNIVSSIVIGAQRGCFNNARGTCTEAK